MSHIGSVSKQKHENYGKGKILRHYNMVFNIKKQDHIFVNLKSQLSKTRIGTLGSVSNQKHKTQGKGKILSDDHIVSNIKSQFSKLGSGPIRNI